MGGGQLVEDQRAGSLGHHAVCSFARPPPGWVRRCERAIISPTWMLRRDMQRRRALEEVPGTASMVSASSTRACAARLARRKVRVLARLAVDVEAARG